MKPVRIPPIAPVLFLVGAAAAIVWLRPRPLPVQPHPLVQQVNAFFEAASSGQATQAGLLAALYAAPPDRLRITKNRLLAVELFADGDGAISTSDVLAVDMGTQAAVKRNTCLYWRRHGDTWELDVDASTIDALTINFLRVVRDGNEAALLPYLPPDRRSPDRARKLLDRYNWLPDDKPVYKQFKVLGVELRESTQRAISTALWSIPGTEQQHRIAIKWLKADGSWWVEPVGE